MVVRDGTELAWIPSHNRVAATWVEYPLTLWWFAGFVAGGDRILPDTALLAGFNTDEEIDHGV